MSRNSSDSVLPLHRMLSRSTILPTVDFIEEVLSAAKSREEAEKELLEVRLCYVNVAATDETRLGAPTVCFLCARRHCKPAVQQSSSLYVCVLLIRPR